MMIVLFHFFVLLFHSQQMEHWVRYSSDLVGSILKKFCTLFDRINAEVSFKLVTSTALGIRTTDSSMVGCDLSKDFSIKLSIIQVARDLCLFPMAFTAILHLYGYKPFWMWLGSWQLFQKVNANYLWWFKQTVRMGFGFNLDAIWALQFMP